MSTALTAHDGIDFGFLPKQIAPSDRRASMSNVVSVIVSGAAYDLIAEVGVTQHEKQLGAAKGMIIKDRRGDNFRLYTKQDGTFSKPIPMGAPSGSVIKAFPGAFPPEA